MRTATARSECLVEIAASGKATTKNGGASSGDLFKPLAPGAIELMGMSTGTNGADTMSSVVGRRGPRRRTGCRNARRQPADRGVAQPVRLVRRRGGPTQPVHEGDRLRRRPAASPDGPMTEASPPPTRHVTTTRIVAVRGTHLEFRGDRVVGEEPLEIRAAGPGQDPVAVAVTMRTPGFEDELAAGFLKTEGLINGSEILRFETGDPTEMNQPDDGSRSASPGRSTPASSPSGTSSRRRRAGSAARRRSTRSPSAPTHPGRPDRPPRGAARAAGPAPCRPAGVRRDGGLHASGLFTPTGELIAIREDVGRHNALDKLVGSQVLAKAMPLHDRIVMVSGRVSFEIVQKAAVAGVPIIAAVSAPSDLAIEAADRLGVTLVGFLRGDGFNVYAHDERIDLRDSAASADPRLGVAARSPVLDELEAEAALDAEVAVGHRRVRSASDLHDLVVLDVQRQRAADAAVRADRVGHRSGLPRPTSRRPHVVLRLEHQRAGRADADAVAAVDARRFGQGYACLGRDPGVEPRPATAIANVFWASSPHASTHL
jgi:FdhD protein